MCENRVRQDTKGYPPPGLSGAHAVYLSTEKAVYLLCGFMGEGHRNEIYHLNIANWSWTHIIIDDNLLKPSPRDKFGAWEHENRSRKSFALALKHSIR